MAAHTFSGIYVGKVVSDKVVSWKGIPYAKVPIGDLRWRAPEKTEKSDKVMIFNAEEIKQENDPLKEHDELFEDLCESDERLCKKVSK